MFKAGDRVLMAPEIIARSSEDSFYTRLREVPGTIDTIYQSYSGIYVAVVSWDSLASSSELLDNLDPMDSPRLSLVGGKLHHV
jgi:hypothetical protein